MSGTLKPTNKKVKQTGRTIYKKGNKNVSELGVSIPLNEEKTKWLNAPSIYNGKELTEKQVLNKYKAGKLKPEEYRIIKGSEADAIKDSKQHSDSLKIIPKKTGGYIGIGKALRGYGSVRKI
tara:strand:- start:4344 stop:4709 length:366 start_codon:yes stop_codon:yes gene_type:complete